jgi:hypothetical protein
VLVDGIDGEPRPPEAEPLDDRRAILGSVRDLMGIWPPSEGFDQAPPP